MCVQCKSALQATARNAALAVTIPASVLYWLDQTGYGANDFEESSAFDLLLGGCHFDGDGHHDGSRVVVPFHQVDMFHGSVSLRRNFQIADLLIS